ncbi:hypothetical protein QBC39DRAFT_353013 [Podospora conica]|nr:hypothetical protein QBC39DRAFT_353013 [Schizothecium conicum]
MDRSSEDHSPSKDQRTRRPHKKSRYGCSKCRERRIKCDEGAPRCSRCEKKDLPCEYPKGRQVGVFRPTEYASHEAQQSFSPSDHLLSLNAPWTASVSLQSSKTDGTMGITPQIVQTLSASVRIEAEHSLGPVDLELFAHFLDHTSKDTTVEIRDQYTLQVGIPRLALQSTFLLKSVLALSCVCRCCDITSKSNLVSTDRQAVMDLLKRAEAFHMESMHEVQTTLHEPNQHDYILANAAMMGMYGSASHWLRIWLAKTSAHNDDGVQEFTPSSTRWIRLFRAVTTAYTGLRFQTPGPGDAGSNHVARAASPTLSDLSWGDHPFAGMTEGEQGRPPPREHVLHSIVAATFQSAMSNLRENARVVLFGQMPVQMVHRQDRNSFDDRRCDEDAQACLAALEVLGDIMDHNFRHDITPAIESPMQSSSTTSLDIHDTTVQQVSTVSPWLQRYISSITSTVPSRLARRYIAAFVHKAPLRFLDMVEEVLASMDSRDANGWLMTPRQQFALNLFAHWLVLVLLLDNVWWIRGIGAWELERIISLTDDREQQQRRTGEKWWPERMLDVWKCTEEFSM